MTVGGVWAGLEERGALVPPVERGPAIEAVISGLEEGGVYQELPPVLVELGRLPDRAAVWVELYRGPVRAMGRGVVVKSRLYSRPGGGAILDVPGISRACEAEGSWTMVVMIGGGLNVQPLAHRTFKVGGGVAGPVPAVADLAAPALPGRPPAG